MWKMRCRCQYDKISNRCIKCNRWRRGFAPKKERKLPVAECQCCGGQQAVRAGLIVKHGYERPGHGYLIGECFGVDFKPYPAYDALERLLAFVVSKIDHLAEEIEAKKIAVVVSYNYGSSRNRQVIEIHEGQKAQLLKGHWIPSFEDVRESHVRGLVAQRGNAISHKQQIEERIAKAKQLEAAQ